MYLRCQIISALPRMLHSAIFLRVIDSHRLFSYESNERRRISDTVLAILVLRWKRDKERKRKEENDPKKLDKSPILYYASSRVFSEFQKTVP